jgi:hypothetical protein
MIGKIKLEEAKIYDVDRHLTKRIIGNIEAIIM